MYVDPRVGHVADAIPRIVVNNCVAVGFEIVLQFADAVGFVA
jgi:hypothetical protein